VQGVSTRRVDDLVKALGMSGISKSQVSRLCQALDTEVERFRTRKLDGPYPFCRRSWAGHTASQTPRG
jgi:putative transposase